MKNPIITPKNPLTATKFVNGGQVLVQPHPDTANKTGFFWNALPGEQIIEFQILKTKSQYFEAVATKLKQLSPKRIQPKDDHFLANSPWQILDYYFELSQKHLILQELFQLLPNHPEIQPVKTDGQDFFYRNKMEYALYYDHDSARIHLAIHQRGTHRKMPILSSSLELPTIFTAAQTIVDQLNQTKQDARAFQSILLRANQSGTVSGGLIPNHQPRPSFPQLTDQILEHHYSYSPNGFFQINLPVYQQALQSIKSFITTEKVLDLYAGVGTIGLSVARDRKLTLVEVDTFAHQELIKNCQALVSSNPHLRPVLAKSEEVLDFITKDTTVILDPPRAGCDAKLLDRLNYIQPPTIIYLSCNPATQVRDLQLLESSYQIQQIIPFNFFPRTPHLENLVILTRR
ncbi:MAG: RsmD family RNA methyltransferase [Candidatus Saccharibacteria bacterium]|nr:RsmD family RNA methyltransferase [Candidatus Saccharibacteria bacterium]